MYIQQILDDGEAGLTHNEIMAKYGISREVGHAITVCSKGLDIEEIEERLKLILTGMTGKQIGDIMQNRRDKC